MLSYEEWVRLTHEVITYDDWVLGTCILIYIIVGFYFYNEWKNKKKESSEQDNPTS